MLKKLLLILALLPGYMVAQTLTNGTNISITKTWSQEPAGHTYPVAIRVPMGAVPQGGFPVCILLHGNGGTGAAIIGPFQNVLQCHALVAPSGYMGTWNICAETSDAPDIEMINDLIDNLQTYSNINPNQIRILGFSNGAGLANRVLIENSNPGVDIICSVVSQLNEPQYHLGDFYYPSGQTDPTASECGYDTPATPAMGRKYLSICNENDPLIDYFGGPSPVGVSFLHAEEASFLVAQSQGYTGTQLLGAGTPFGNPVVNEFSYLGGQVVHLKGDAQHGMNSTQESYITDYFQDCAPPVGVEELISNSIEVYPNPGNGEFQVQSNFAEPTPFRIYSIHGELVQSGVLQSNLEQIDVSSLSGNVFFLEVGDDVLKLLKIQ